MKISRILSLIIFSLGLLAAWIGTMVESGRVWIGILLAYFVFDKIYRYWKAEIAVKKLKEMSAKYDEMEKRVEEELFR